MVRLRDTRSRTPHRTLGSTVDRLPLGATAVGVVEVHQDAGRICAAFGTGFYVLWFLKV